MDFITIDFETATEQRDSPCEIGLTFVKDFNIIETKSWLIQPFDNEYNPFNIFIHGITPADTENEPEFDEIWQEVHPLIENHFLIAHNASFDMSVLRRTLESYGLPFPYLKYSCSQIFSRKIWDDLPNYGLKSLCEYHNIELDHHRAANDSLATAELTLKAFEHVGVQSIEDFPIKLKATIGELFPGGYKAAESKRVYNRINIDEINGDPEKLNPENLFYGKSVVFTGTLMSMVRKDAQQLIVDIGGILHKTVTKDTDFLIVGQQDFRYVGEDGMSNKQEKAVKLIEKGAKLEILSEEDFFNNI